MMDHIVYLDAKAKELEHLRSGQKSMIIRGAMGRKMPFAGKRYLVLITLEDFTDLEPFGFDRSGYTNMDDWLPVENIQKVRRG